MLSPPLYVYRDFFKCLRAANIAVGDHFWPNFKFIQDSIEVLIICMNEEDMRKNEAARAAIFYPL